MRYREIQEAPISNYKTLSDQPTSTASDPNGITKDPKNFAKRSSSYTHKQDRVLLTNPNAVQQMKKKWENTDYDFAIYVVNSKEARNHMEIGKVNREWLETNMPSIEPYIKEPDDEIIVLFTNNKGEKRVPMTPWIMAHRLAHAFSRYGTSSNGRTVSEYTSAEEEIKRVVVEMLKDDYGWSKLKKDDIWTEKNYNTNKMIERVYRKFFEAIGTFRSARSGNLRNDFEFLNEIIAQYIITGSIKFNPTPRLINLGRGNGTLRFKGKDKKESDEILEMLGRTLEYHVDSMMGQSVNGIFVM